MHRHGRHDEAHAAHHARMHEAWRHHHRHPPPRMQRWLFFSFGVAIVATMFVSSTLFRIFVGPFGPGGPGGPGGLHPHGPHHGVPFVPLAVAAAALWILSGWLARRLTMPLRALGHVAEELGAGQLGSRVKLPHRGTREVIELAHAFNTMAERIAVQIQGQKDLLSAVSHELRTPLSRMRVLVELARDQNADAELLTRMEREIADMDALVGELLASARIDTGALQKTRLSIAEILAPLRSDAALADVEITHAHAEATLDADPTLLSRALRILLDNAAKYGGKRVTLRVVRDASSLAFEVTDDGAGFSPDDLSRVLEPFTRGQQTGLHAGVGLGLYLVRRIAEAHGGKAFAENRADGGARVGFSVRTTAAGGTT